MNIDWAALVRVAGVSLAFGVGIVAVFSVGLLGATQVVTARSGSTAPGERAEVPGRGRVQGAVLAAICFAACAAAVLFGLYLLIPQFHGK